MAGFKNVYNSTTLDCALELVWRTLGVKIDRESVDCTVSSVSGEYSRLHLAARSTTADGSVSSYYGMTDFTYRKVDLETILPKDLVYDGEYPTTFERLQQYLKFSYDFNLEEHEFVLVGGSAMPLKAGDVINVAANAQGQIVLSAHVNSGRWLAGTSMRFKLLAL